MLVVSVDDNPRDRDFIKRALQPQQHIVESFDNAFDAMNYIRDHPVDVVLLDNKLRHGPDGLTLAQQVRDMRPECVIIMISAYPEPKYFIEALQAHVDDFIIKGQIDPQQLNQRMGKATLKRRRLFPALQSSIRQVGALEIDPVGETATWHGELLTLTTMEFRILLHLVSKPGHVFSFAELYFLSTGEHIDPKKARTKVKSHVTNLRPKLEQGGRYPQNIVSAYGRGFKWEDAGQEAGSSLDDEIEDTDGDAI